METYMIEALNKLADIKNNIIEIEHLSDPPEDVFGWGLDPFYTAHRNVSLELIHKGHVDAAWKLFDDFVKYHHPDKLQEARRDLQAVYDSLIPLNHGNIEHLFKKYNGVVLLSDIRYTEAYANYVFVNVSDDERDMMMDDEYNRAMPFSWILREERALNHAFLDVHNTKLNNGRYPYF